MYSLAEPLIRAIQRECPGLLNENDIQFELELRHVAGDGFFRGAKFVYSLHAEYGGATPPVRRSGLPTEEEILASQGLNAAQIGRAMSNRAKFRAALRERQAGYAGWLATKGGIPC